MDITTSASTYISFNADDNLSLSFDIFSTDIQHEITLNIHDRKNKQKILKRIENADINSLHAILHFIENYQKKGKKE